MKHTSKTMNASKRHSLFFCCFIISAFAFSIATSGSAHAAVIVVNSLADNTTNGDTFCTLREAVTAANNNADFNDCVGVGNYGSDTITFHVSGTITLVRPLQDITDSAGLTIDGRLASINISGDNARRVFRVSSGAALTLHTLSISNGKMLADDGGGIDNLGILTVINSTLSSNEAGHSGGGIHNTGTLTITNSTLSGNIAHDGGGGFANEAGGIAVITNSTLSGNRALSSDGGGIANSGIVIVTNTTLSRNSSEFEFHAATNGGGIFNKGRLTITNSTLSNNTTDEGQGSAIFSMGPNTTTVKSSIFVRDPHSAGTNCGGTITDGGFNINDDGGCDFSAANNSQDNTDPLLDPAGLQNNGGPTQTIALQSISPAINAIPIGKNGCGTSIVTDQRGFLRAGLGRENCDVGAFEANSFFLGTANGFLEFTPDKSSFTTVPDTAGCPPNPVSGSVDKFIGKLAFSAGLTNETDFAFSGLVVSVSMLSNGNLLLLPDAVIGGVGTTFAVPGGFNETLRKGESLSVPFAICLRNRNPFSFFVDVLGVAVK